MSESSKVVSLGNPNVDSGAELGRAIVRLFRENEIHPVLLFGTATAGKTMALYSMLQYLNQKEADGVQKTTGDLLWPKDDKNYQAIQRDASFLLDNALSKFFDGLKPGSTQRENPIFLPVNLTVNGVVTKLAFLEGNGEWYHRENDTADAPFRAMQPIIEQVLRNYEHGMSFIFVAPCVDGPQGQPKAFAHEALANAMGEVARIREEKNRDNLLLLLSKWDGLCSPSDDIEKFADPNFEFMEETIREWKYVWAKFIGLSGYAENAKSVMPYSAAWVNKSGEIIKSKHYQPFFNRFNRVLWNWIYGNSSVAFPSRPGTLPSRKILYDDVAMPETPRTTIYDNLVRIVAGR